MEVWTHRGIGLGQENTPKAFAKAVELGVHIEADVRTQANVPVMRHNEIRNSAFSRLFRKNSFPLLEEVLTQYGSAVKIDLDIKDDSGPQVLEMVQSHELLERVLFTSASFGTVQDIKKRESGATVGFILNEDATEHLPLLQHHGIDYVVPSMKFTTPKVIEDYHEAGIAVLPWFEGSQTLWTPEMESDINQAAEYSVEGVIVNHVPETLKLMNSRSPQSYPLLSA